MSDLDGGSAAPAAPDVPRGGQMRAPGSVQPPPRPSVAPPSPPSTGGVRVDRAVVDGWPAGMVAIDLERAVARRQPVTLCGVVYAPADGPDHSGVAGEPEATTEEAPEIDSPGMPTQVPVPDPTEPVAAILAVGTVVSDGFPYPPRVFVQPLPCGGRIEIRTERAPGQVLHDEPREHVRQVITLSNPAGAVVGQYVQTDYWPDSLFDTSAEPFEVDHA